MRENQRTRRLDLMMKTGVQEERTLEKDLREREREREEIPE